MLASAASFHNAAAALHCRWTDVSSVSDMSTEAACRNPSHPLVHSASITLFGTTAKSTAECRKLEPQGVVAFHQADVGEYLRDEDTLC